MTGDLPTHSGKRAASPPPASLHRHRVPLRLSAPLFGLAYFACAEAGNLLSLQEDTYVSFWLPAGLYLAVLLLSERRSWPWLVLAALAGNAAFDAVHGTPLRAIPFFCAANALQSLSGAWLIQRFVSPALRLTTLKELAGLLFFGAVLSTALGAGIGAATLVSIGISPSFTESFRVWWGSCGMAVLIVSPFILSWFPGQREPLLKTPKHILEAGLLLAGATIVVVEILVLKRGIASPKEIWIIPFLLWAGLRFAVRGAATASLALGIVLSLSTAAFLKSHPEVGRVEDYVFILQTSLAVAALVALIPAIVLGERDRTMAELRASQERFELAMRGSNDGYWDWNILTNEVYFSDRFRELLEYTAEEFPPSFSTFQSHLHPDDRERVRDRIQAHLERQERYDIEYRMRTRSGQYRWFQARGHAVWNEKGSPVRMAGSLTDITERHEAEAALRESEQKFSTAFRASPDVMSITELESGRYLEVNDVHQKLFGISREEVIGRSPAELGIISSSAQYEELVRELKKSGSVREKEVHVRNRAGEDLIVLLSAERVQLNGRDCVLRVSHDVTQSKRAQEALRQSEERFRSYFDLPIVGLAIASLERGFVAVNDQFCSILGYSRDELMKSRWSDLTHPDDLAADLAQFNCVLAGEHDGYTLEKRFIRKDKSAVPAALSVRCVRRADGSPDYFIAMLQDITERKRAEAERAEAVRREQQALEDYTRQLISSQEAERRRIAGELHDSLGQNLLLIRNRVQLALAPQSPEALAGQLAAIGQLASEAVAEVRHISHDLRPYQLDELGLTYALRLLIDGVEQSSGISIERRLEQADDAVTAEGATNLYRIVQECLTNILKHSQARCARVELERDVRHLRLWIKDDGRGFAASEFEPGSPKGGLGLRNIFERVRILAGTLKIHSAPGHGTSIEITIPTAELEPEPLPA